MTASRPQFRIFAVTGIPGCTRACASAGDAAADSGGQVLKVMGDGTLMLFPPDSPNAVVDRLKVLQREETDRLRLFEERCRLQVKVGIGVVEVGSLGPPDDRRTDIIGDALNRLIKAPWEDFVLSPELSDRLE
jgi:class 3 adenylate cyclase